MLVRVLLFAVGATGAFRRRRGAVTGAMAWARAWARAGGGSVPAARRGRIRARGGDATRWVFGITTVGAGGGDGVRRWGRYGGGASDGAGAWGLVVGKIFVVSVGGGLVSAVVFPVRGCGVNLSMLEW